MEAIIQSHFTNKINFLLILSLVSLSGCFDFLGSMCWGGGEYTYMKTDLHIIEGHIDNADFNITRSMNFDNYDDYHPVHYALNDEYRFTTDKAAIILNRYNTLVLNYGLSVGDQDSLWENRSYYSMREDMQDFDLHVKSARYVINEEDYGSLEDTLNNKTYDDVLIASLLKLKPVQEDELTILLRSKTEFIDENKYLVKEINSPRFTVNNGIIFISNQRHYLITSDSTESKYYHNLYYKEFWLMHLDSDNNLDTLFQLPSSLSHFSHNLDLQINGNTIAVNDKETIYLMDYNGEILFEHDHNGSLILNSEGSSLTFNNGKYYFRHTDQKLINVSAIIDNLTYSFPTDDYILATENDQKIHIIRVDSEEIISTISMDMLPKLEESPDKHSEYNIYLPVITSEDKIRFIYSDSYLIDDPDDPCD